MIKLLIAKSLNASEGKMNLNVNFELPEGKIIAIYGNSGAGKTSLLRIIAGFLKPDAGSISIGSTFWQNSVKKLFVSPQKRKVGFVFQDYALFPNMTILENLEYALANKSDTSIVEELIETTELDNLRHRKPETLSGGQKQRVALARALIRKPDLLLLDEPLSALDNKMRLKLQDYILKMYRKYSLTIFIVTHDIAEIVKLADLVLVLDKGEVKSIGTPLEVFSHKKISGKFQFTGEIVQIEKEDIIYVISVLVGNNLIKVVADKSEISDFKIGDRVLVATKAFNPMIEKLNSF